MDIGRIGSGFYGGLTENAFTDLKTDRLSKELKNAGKEATDAELMKACKSFESYMLEQVFEKMEEMAYLGDEKERENEYLSMFKDTFFKDTAEKITKHSDFGIAKMLYESMKRNGVGGMPKQEKKTES